MSTILIVDDRPANREFLVTLLGYGGHRLLEAADGAEGLAVTRAARPDLVIADILMPTMDGYEFVRRLRADPAIADTRVIFYTAHYHEPEARKLAAACGVSDVLTKPCEPEVVLQTVEAALGHAPPPAAAPAAAEFDREHLHLLTDKLSRHAEESRRTSERLTALVELGLQLGSERDPGRLLQAFGDAAREIVGARYAVVGVPDGTGPGYRHFLTGGMDVATAARVGRPGPLGGVLGSVLSAGRCFRAGNHGGLEAAGVPASFPRASALLAAPVVSPARVYGWVCLLDKVGGDVFTDEDERLARMLGAQVGRIYENGTLYADLLRHSSKLAEEVTERTRAEVALRESEAHLRGFFEASSAGMVEADAVTGRILRANATYCHMLGYAPGEVVGLTPEDFMFPEDLTGMVASYSALREGRVDAYDVERRYRRKDGSELWVQASAALVRDAEGRPERIAAVLSDLTERKRAEVEVRRSTDLLRAVADGTTDAVFVKDRAGKYLLFNEAAARFVGRPVAEVLGKDDTALFDPDGALLVIERDRRVMASGRTETEEETLTAAGVTRTYLATKGPYRDASGNVVGVIGISRDVTERKRLEAERDELLTRLQLQIERMPLAYVLFDADLRVSEWNPAAERIFGYCKQEVVGIVPLGLIVPPSAEEQTGEVIRRLRSGDMAAHSVNENLTKGGRTITCEWYNTPLMGEDGRFDGLFCLAQDVTERRRLEEQVREARQRLEHVVASSPAVLYALAGQGPASLHLTWISGNVREMTGDLPEEAVRPTWWHGRLHPADREQVLANLQTLFDQNHTTDEYRFRHRDGTYRWVRAEMRLLRDGSGSPLEVIGSWSDISVRKQVEEQFRQAQKMEAIGRLAGGVAHDFNNLLTIINGYGELVLETLPAGDPTRELIREIVSAGERAAGLTRQLLAFSRKAIVEPKVLNLRAVVADVERMLRRIVGEDIQLAVKADPEAGAVRADPGQVEQVILNLVVNARDAMPTGGKLTIEVRDAELDETYTRDHPDIQPGPYVLLAVTDTGCGMDTATITRIFEPFFSTKGEHGTGLGLATVHGIVKQSGGHVAVYSEVGHGTTFKVYLPRVEKTRTASGSRPGLSVMPRGSETILLVEDEDGVRALTRHVLRSCGYTVLEARDGGEAVRLAGGHRGRIDLLVTDVVMPRMGGREVAQRTAGLHPRMRVLFLSGYTDDAVVRHGILEAEVAFLQKPFTPASLAQKVREVLDDQ
jgi:PAS domain S-box-containing protein